MKDEMLCNIFCANTLIPIPLGKANQIAGGGNADRKYTKNSSENCESLCTRYYCMLSIF